MCVVEGNVVNIITTIILSVLKYSEIENFECRMYEI